MSGREFEDLASFGLHLAALERTTGRALRRGLEKALVVIETNAKAQIGQYQPAVSEFPA